jgi:hypothetical protein
MPNIITAASLPWAQSALAVLQAAQTLAGVRVEDEPNDPFTDAEMPAIGIHSATSRDNVSRAGTNINTRLTLSLYFELFTVAAESADAVAQMDVLEEQVLANLLRDPYWPAMFGPIATINTRRQWIQGERINLESMIEIVGDGIIEKWATGTISVLGQGGAPTTETTPQTVAPPLETITSTITNQLGGTATRDVTIPQS